MKGFLFISNGTKPTTAQLNSRENIRLDNVSLPCIEAASRMGYEIHKGVNRNRPEELKTSSNFKIHFYDQHSYRNILNIKDIWIAYKNADSYLKQNPQIKVIHCNTPIGGVIGRLIGQKHGCKVIYTAHGFHFFKGAPIFNRIILKSIEKWLARYTDVIITINQEDYESAKKFKLKKGGKVFKVPGVGVNLTHNNIKKTREEVFANTDVPMDTFICICMGDLVKRKNYKTSIEAFEWLKDKDIHFLICGKGPELKSLKKLCKKLKVASQIHFLGYRDDIKDLLNVSNCFLFSSLQEGLPRSTMEAMTAGIPCVISNIRGNIDLVNNNLGGILINPTDAKGFANGIKYLYDNPTICQSMGDWNRERIKQFSIDIVREHINKIYSEVL